MKILLVDATFYRKQIDNDLKKLKEQYFKIKKHIQDKYLGIIDDSNTRIFSQGLLRIATLMKRAGEEIEFISLEDLKDENHPIRQKISDGYFNKKKVYNLSFLLVDLTLMKQQGKLKKDIQFLKVNVCLLLKKTLLILF